MFVFYSKELLAPLPTPQTGGPPVVGYWRMLIQCVFAVSNRDVRTRRAARQVGTHVWWGFEGVPAQLQFASSCEISDSFHRSAVDAFALTGSYTAYVGTCSPTFRDNLWFPFTNSMLLTGSLSPRHGQSSFCGRRRRPPTVRVTANILNSKFGRKFRSHCLGSCMSSGKWNV